MNVQIGKAKVLLTSKTDAVDEEASLPDEWDVAYVAKHEKVLLLVTSFFLITNPQ